jgi:hypothetical protein
LAHSYDVEVHTKGILRVSGRRWEDLLVRAKKEGVVEREAMVYRTVLEDVKKYLAKKYLNKSKFLPIPGYVKIVWKNPNEQLRRVFILENMRHLNYKRDLIKNCEGLNYEHSVLVVATLARFHATTYCLRKEKPNNLEDLSILQKSLAIPSFSIEIIQRMERILKTFPDHEKYSINFVETSKLEKSNSNL